MIQLNELRVGNYISAMGKITTQVEGFCIWDGLIQNSDFAERDVEDFDEILLTEEWLIKFGFKLCNNFWFELKYYTDCIDYNECFLISYNLNSNRLGISDYEEGGSLIYTSKRIKYVHELQNLYFALTTKELKL